MLVFLKNQAGILRGISNINQNTKGIPEDSWWGKLKRAPFLDREVQGADSEEDGFTFILELRTGCLATAAHVVTYRGADRPRMTRGSYSLALSYRSQQPSQTYNNTQ